MKTYPVTFLQLGLLTGTRAIAGIGLGVLLAIRVEPRQRKAIGWSIFGTGVALYASLMADLLLRNRGKQEKT